jgi:ABC-type uncharacterized transport system substrate-binding protein
MTKKITVLTLCAMLFALSVSARAQQAGKTFRIGFLERSTASGMAGLSEAFREEMHKLGWIEGKNITFEFRVGDQKTERLPGLAAELVRLKVDVIVTGGVQPARAAKEATVTIPIVMAQHPDPVGIGLVASLARPGGNVTGLSSLANELSTKRLEILKDVVPKLARVGILFVPGTRINRDLSQKELRTVAMALNLKLEEIETQPDAKGFDSAFQTAKQKQVGAIMPSPARLLFGERKRIVELAVKYRLPAIYAEKEYVDEGGLMSYGADQVDNYRRAAVYVDKILRGAKPADLPVQQATKFEFVINLKAAKQIGLTIPVDLLQRANKVIR